MSLSEHALSAHEKTCQYKNMPFVMGMEMQTQMLGSTMNSVFSCKYKYKIAHKNTFVNAS